MADSSKPKEESNPSSNSKSSSDFVVTPWDTSGNIDYMKLVNQFGTELISKEQLEKFKRVTGKELHPWLKRGIFFTHRALDTFLDAYERGDPVFLYTGRGPTTDAMHIGHLIPFLFTKWMQDTFNCPLCIQISDDEKAAFKPIPFEDIYKMGFNNAKEIISCGFDPKKTFIFSNRDYRLKCPQFENFCSEMKNSTSMKSVQSIFGMDLNSNVFQYDWPVYQSIAAFSQSYPHIFGNRPAYCIVPHAIDQDPYFRLARDNASKMHILKPSNIMCSFIPPLTGADGKMSSSKAAGGIFLTDDEETIRNKVMTLCYSGADPDPEVHKKKGGDVEKDIAYQYLRFFENDDAVLEKYKIGFSNGSISAVEIKEHLVECLWKVVKEIQDNRKKIDEEYLNEFYKMKPIELPKPKMKEKTPMESSLYSELDQRNIKYEIKYHNPITTKDEEEELNKVLPKGTSTKGILMKSKEGFIFNIISIDTIINPKTLMKKIKTKSLKFADSDTSNTMLKVNGKLCPSIYAIMNDKEKKILKVLVDNNIDKESMVHSFALREDATCSMNYEDMIKFIEGLGYTVENVEE